MLVALLANPRAAAAQAPGAAAATEPAVYVYASPGGKRAGIVIFHGGGWSKGEPSWAFARARYFAERGLVAVAAHLAASAAIFDGPPAEPRLPSAAPQMKAMHGLSES